MSNQVFDFGPHRVRTRHQETPVVQLGRGFTSGVKPFHRRPRIFVVTFDQSALRIFYTSAGAISPTNSSPRNLLRLESFADFHGTHESFLYNHSVYGQLRVRFQKAYEAPEVMNSLAQEFTLELVEVPS